MTAGRGGIEGSQPHGGPARHTPVLLPEVLSALKPVKGGLYIDGTFGAGGYARAILDAAACRVLALDRDPAAIADGQALKRRYGERLILAESRFSAMEDAAAGQGFRAVDGVALDLGVSSMQIDEPERGFSFLRDGPLDMRMSSNGLSAADVVNDYEEQEIADILYEFGEERRSRALARAIMEARKQKPIERTSELAAICAAVLGHKPGDKHPATRTFQALRVYVNDELGELQAALEAAERLLRPGGRLAVVTFHSLEDRIVKRFLALRSGRAPSPSRHAPPAAGGREPSFVLVNRKPIEPQEAEIARNPRARSALLRAAERTTVPPFPPEPMRKR